MVMNKLLLLLVIIIPTIIGSIKGDEIYAPVGYQTNIVTEQYPQLSIRLSYNNGYTYDNMPTPDQYMIRQSDLTAEMTQVTDIMVTESEYYSEVERTCKTSFGLGVPGIASVNFAYSKTQTDLYEMFRGGLNACMQQFILLPVIQIDLQTSALMDPSAPLIQGFAMLPPTCTSSSDQNLYKKFITYMGTDLIPKGYKGGYTTYMSCISQSYIQQYGMEETSEQFKLSFKVFNINLGLDTSTSASSVQKMMNKQFVDHEITDIKFYGGINLTETNYYGQWNAWTKSIKANVTSMSFLPYGAVLTPLSDYILDETKSNCLQNAIVNYINTNNLNAQFKPAEPSVHNHVHNINFEQNEQNEQDEQDIENFGDIGRGFDANTYDFRLNVFKMVSSGNVIPGTTNTMLPINMDAFPDRVSEWSNMSLPYFSYGDMYNSFQRYYVETEVYSGSKDKHATMWSAEYMSQDYSFCDAIRKYIIAQITINPYIAPLDDGLNKTLTMFETQYQTYDYNALYTYIIEPYGTEICEVSKIGGMVRFSKFMHNCVIASQSESAFADQVNKEFGLHMDYNTGYSLQSWYQNTQFQASISYALGGSTTYSFDPASMHQWFDTIADNPVTVGCDFVRLPKVLAPYFPITAANLDIAITAYIQGSKLNDFARTKQVFPYYPDQWVGDPNCYPCYSTCKSQNVCPGDPPCHYYVGCAYGTSDYICGYGMTACITHFQQTGGCANQMAAHHDHMCACSGGPSGPITESCGEGSCVPN